MQSLTADPFGQALETYWTTGRARLTLIRSDGRPSYEDMGVYFSSYREFLPVEKRLLRAARGRVLDLGCGAGRHSLYLQRRGLHVTAVDASPRAAAIASARGVRDVRVAEACRRLPFPERAFDLVLLLGNNLGLCGSRRATQKLLRELGRVTRARARILATTRAPGAFNPVHLAYWNDKLGAGAEFGIVNLTLKFGEAQQEVNLLLLAPSELAPLVWQSGWRLVEVIGDGRADEGYGAILEKRP